MVPLDLTYVLPIKCSADLDREELTAYLAHLASLVREVIMVDGSDATEFSANAAAWGSLVRHLAPDADLRYANGKVNGVTTGIRAAGHERVVIADDDVRYELEGLTRAAQMLDDADLVRPQNFFGGHLSWHAQLDTARTLLNRAVGRDYPGTFAIRRSFFVAMGGYDGGVLFENLELMRTLERAGGRIESPLDLYVERRPPSTARFFDQRVRQAYDEFALPPRLVVWLSIVPFVGWVVAGRRRRAGTVSVLGAIGLAELGRRRAGGTQVFGFRASLLAPAWLVERGICMWLAVGRRIRGGVRYGDALLKKAANPR